MRSRWTKRRVIKQRLGIALLLITLFRFYVPVGYMPDPSLPFALAICPEGLPADAHALHHHVHGAPGTHEHFAHCPFGALPAAGPSPYAVMFAAAAPAVTQRPDAFVPFVASLASSAAHQPRAPPFPFRRS